MLNPKIFTAVALLLCTLFAASCKRTPTFVSAATVQVSIPEPKGTADPVEIILSHLPGVDSDVEVAAIANTDLVSIRVTDPDPHVAAQRANELVQDLRKSVGDAGSGVRVIIHEEAMPAPH